MQRNFLENGRAFWKKVKANGGTTSNVGIESKDSIMLTKKNEVKGRWKKHFSELLGGEQVEDSTMGEEMNIEELEERDGMIQEEITKKEIRKGVGKLKKRKAEGICGISGELLKPGGEIVVKWLYKIYTMVWRTGVAPADRQRAIIIPIHKKSSWRKCGNYRGITMLSILGKVFIGISNVRVRLLTDNWLLEEQAGFRSGRGVLILSL